MHPVALPAQARDFSQVTVPPLEPKYRRIIVY
jgi:hypothetical protein